MTRLEFTLLCTELTIDPSIALENEEVKAALIDRKTAEEIREILNRNF